LIAELVHPQHRAIFTTIYNSTWYLGSIVAAWLTYGTFKIPNAWSWRIPSIVQAGPSAIQLVAIWMVPESPRYLIAKGKNEKALNILAKAHANGNVEDELVQLEYREIRETIQLEKEFEQNGWTEFFVTKGNRHRLVILISLGFFSQWSGNGLVSYYMNDVLSRAGVTDPKLRLEINGILNIINFLTALTMCFFIDKFGRRPLFLLPLPVCAHLSASGLSALPSSPSMGIKLLGGLKFPSSSSITYFTTRLGLVYWLVTPSRFCLTRCVLRD